MDENLARLNRIYPNCGYVKISPYNPETFKTRPYDSSFDTKSPLNRWNSKPMSYDEAQQWVGEGGRVGWVIPRGYVIIDIDNKDDPRAQMYIEKLLEKFEVAYSYNYTSKGIHILFRDTTESIKTDSRTKCGLNILVDTRANKSGYIVLPCNDPHRKWGKWNDVVEDLPYFLRPLLKDNTMSFIGMQNGDGRNDALFKWRTKLEQSHKLNKSEIEKCIRIINENLFDTPMTNQELFKTVLRERDNVDEDIEKENKFNRLADEFVGKYDIISGINKFYMFNGMYYRELGEIELEQLIHRELSKNVTRNGRHEIMEFIRLKTQVSPSVMNKEWHKIACNNGIINLVTGELEEPSKADYNTIFIPHNYDNDPPYSARIDQFMKEVSGGDPIKMLFLYQIAGYCLVKQNIFQKFFIFRGEGGTGKSTYMNLLEKLVGKDNCAHVALSDFDKEYYIYRLLDKLMNIDDDVIDTKALEGTGRFKSIVSGDKISARQIYADVVDFIPFSTLVFSCNKLPKIMDKTSGLYRRMVLIELNHKPAKPDPLFLNKVTEQDMEYFLFKAVEGIKMALEEGHFRIMQSEEQLIRLFQRRQSPLNEWIHDCNITFGDLYEHNPKSLYSQFVVWCDENGYAKKLSSFTFKEDMCSLYDCEIRYINQDDKTAAKPIFFKPGEVDLEFNPFKEG